MAVILVNCTYKYYHLEQPLTGAVKGEPKLSLQSGTYTGYLTPARSSEGQAVYYHDQRVDYYLYTDANLRWYAGDVVERESDNARFRVMAAEPYRANLPLDHTRVLLEAL